MEKPSKSSLSDLPERTTLGLVGRHRLMFPEALAALASYKNVSEASKALRLLAKKRYLQAHTGEEALATGVPYYSLSPLGATVLGLSRDRATGYGTGALSSHLALLWLCAFEGGDSKLMRVDNAAINQALGTSIHHNNHHICQQEQNDRIVVYRCYAPSTALRSIATWATTTLRKLPTPLKQAVAHGDYGFWILAETQPAVEQIRKYLNQSYKRNKRVNQRVRIQISVGPNTATFHQEYQRKFKVDS